MQIWICKICGRQFGIDKGKDGDYLKSVVGHMMSHAKDPESIRKFYKIKEEKERQSRSSDN